MNLTCNSTLDDMRITTEVKVAGPFTFHQLALIIGGASTAFSILMSFYLIWMHALHYTKPNEQKQIIRILFMVPVYAASSFLCIWFYWHAVYYQVISDCYEAFAISSFFALLCHYIGPDLHEQKDYFRHMRPIKGWVWPLNWFKKCCGGERGPWRTPKSGLTWFNIIWIGIYQYCFIRVAMTITAVVTQYFGRYCESSNSPVFSHIWVLVIESIAVSIAMYCVIQFYIQLRVPLGENQPFLKVLAIKLVIFLSFWQSTVISLATSTLNIVHPGAVLAYPDLKVGIPSLLLCVEMACFSILHLWAFPYRPYLDTAKKTFYPVADPDSGVPPKLNEHYPRAGGFLGFRAIFDAINIWDVIKAFGRGMRWLFVGVKHRRDDVSYRLPVKGGEMDDLSPMKQGMNNNLKPYDSDTSYNPNDGKSTDHLPIATEFRRSKFGIYEGDGAGGAGVVDDGRGGRQDRVGSDEAAALIAHAQPMSGGQFREDVSPPRMPYRDQYPQGPTGAQDPFQDPGQHEHEQAQQPFQPFRPYQPYQPSEEHYAGSPPQSQAGPANPRNSTQARVGEALWGPRDDAGRAL